MGAMLIIRWAYWSEYHSGNVENPVEARRPGTISHCEHPTWLCSQFTFTLFFVLIIFKMAQTHSKFQTYAFTLRPRGGVTEAQIAKLCKYCKNKAEWYKVVTEKEGDERHIHAVWVLKEAVTRGNVLTYLQRMYKDLDNEEQAVMT